MSGDWHQMEQFRGASTFFIVFLEISVAFILIEDIVRSIKKYVFMKIEPVACILMFVCTINFGAGRKAINDFPELARQTCVK